MTWDTTTWDGFCALLEEAWPGDFDDHARGSWRILLDGLNPAVAMEAVRRLLHEGRRFRPSVSEILAAARNDPSRPTFAEAFQLIFGRKGALSARPPGGVYRDERERTLARHQAILNRAADLHPLVASFIDRQGIRRLLELGINDPDWGDKRRADLERAWNQHVDTMDGRDVATLALGGSRRGQLGRFDPLAALSSTRPALPAGETETS